MPIEVALEHYHVNALAPLALFQATLSLLKKSSNPKFVALSTRGSSMAMVPKYTIPLGGYGQSKASLNYIMVKLAHENPDITIFPINRAPRPAPLGKLRTPMILLCSWSLADRDGKLE